MVVLGLVLLVGAGVLTAAVITSNTGVVGADVWGLHISNLSLGGVFVVGVATGVVGLLGLVMLFSGMRHVQRLRRERRELARENARLAQYVDDTEQRGEPDAWPAKQKPVVEPADAAAERAAESGRGPVYERPPYGNPPPAGYDRAAIESDYDRPADGNYAPRDADDSAAAEAARRHRR